MLFDTVEFLSEQSKVVKPVISGEMTQDITVIITAPSSTPNKAYVDERLLTKVDTTVLTSELLKKADVANTYTKLETDAHIQAVVGDAPSNLNTLQELATQVLSNNDTVETLGTNVNLLSNNIDYLNDKFTILNAYDIAFSLYGKVTTKDGVRFLLPRSIIFPENLAGSVASAVTAATTTVVLTLLRNGIGVATITFNASSTGVFSTQPALHFAQGDRLSVTVDIDDTTLADIDVSLTSVLV